MRVAVRWYYRAIEVEGLERIPATGAVILAANHNNALVDALVVGSRVAREVRLTAKATLLSHPLTRVVVHATGLVPLRRVSDEARGGENVAATRNEGAFEAIIRTLAGGGVILIFPEGISHSEPALAPLRTGCARMALQALDAGVPEVTLVPIGLTFEAKGRPRSRVLLSVGSPIPASTMRTARDPVHELTNRLAAGLHDVTLNFPSRDAAERVLSVSRTIGRLFDSTRPLQVGDVPLGETVRVARAVDDVRRALPGATIADLAAIDAFVDALERWRRRAEQLGVAPGEVDMDTSLTSGLWFAIREGFIAAAAFPVAVWGRLHHVIPLRLAFWLGRMTSRNPDEPAMHTLIGGFVLVLSLYILLAFVVARLIGWPGTLLYLLSLPLAASLDFWWSDRWRALTRRVRGFRALRRDPAEAANLLRERDELRRGAQALAHQLGPTDA
jgi:glycerol-3-phosphate O-acyltransferase / dihydroxyacetone phosphate acyltransferase